MHPLTRTDLMPLETYAVERPAFRARVLAHKRTRRLPLGPHVTLLFEDRLTVQYQIQEMLRIERIFEPAGIQAELDAYNALVPGGGDLRATLLIEYPDAVQRRTALATLGGIEDRVFAEVEGIGRATGGHRRAARRGRPGLRHRRRAHAAARRHHACAARGAAARLRLSPTRCPLRCSAGC